MTDSGDTSGLHGYTLWSVRGAPKADLSRVTLHYLVSAQELPNGVLMCDNTWELRAAMSSSSRAEQRNADKLEALTIVAEAFGLDVQTKTVSRSWAEMEGLL